MDNLIEIARHSPVTGLGLAGVLFAGGAFLFWGDPKRMMGMGPLAGMPLLMLAVLVAGASVVFYLHGRVTGRRRDDGSGMSSFSEGMVSQVEPSSGTLPAGSVPRDGLAFEKVVAAHFRGQGYEVDETGTHGRGGDRGVDLLLRRPDSDVAPTICVQCKDYAEWKVGAPAVREFAGAVRLRGPGHVGWIVTTGRFTADAVRDAAALDLRLIDGEAWASMRRAAGVVAGGGSTSVMANAASRVADVPLCPACRRPMVRRGPKPGGRQFRPFWGCANYPRCRGTVDIA